MGLFYFHYHIKWDDICHYKWKFKIERWTMYSSEKKAKFHFKSETRGQRAITLLILSIYTPSSCTHTLCGRFLWTIYFSYNVFPLISAPGSYEIFKLWGVALIRGWHWLEGGIYFKFREMNSIKCQNLFTIKPCTS